MAAEYYKNPFVNTTELSSPLDATAFFQGSKSEKEKQDMMDKLINTYNGVVSPLRALGYNFSIGRSYSEGAANHGTGYALDLVPPSKSFKDAYSLAEAAANLEVCEQVWIEASDDNGNFHVHVKLDPSGKNSNPQLKTIMKRDGSGVKDGLVFVEEKVSGATGKASNIDDAQTLTPGQTALESSGLVQRPGFMGNQAVTAAGKAFLGAASSGGGMGGVIDAIRQVKDSTNGSISKQTINRAYDLPWDPTIAAEVAKVANKIAQLSNIRFEDAEDFLYILITIDSHEVMIKFATATDIAELADANIMMKPLEILAIPGIEKVAYLADAISAILRAYRKYTNAENYDNKGESKSNSDSLAAIQKALGLLTSFTSKESPGGSVGPMNAGGPGSILGPLLTKLLQGKEVPMGVQANNPMLQPRTIINMMMFGASHLQTHVFDFDNVFSKPMAVFGDMGAGAGSSLFSSKNTPSLNVPQSLGNIIGKTARNVFSVVDVVESALSNELGPAGESFESTAVTQGPKPKSLSAAAAPAESTTRKNEQAVTVDPNDKEKLKLLKQGEELSDLVDQIGDFAKQLKKMPFAPPIIDKITSGIGEMVIGALGGKLTDSVDLTKADNAVPIQSAMANAMNSLQDVMPQVTGEMRKALEGITSTMDGIGSLFSTMTNLENALKTGLTPQSLMAVAGMFSGSQIKPPTIFPTSIFQEGWQNMAAVNQALGKDNRFYQQVLYILNQLG